jgi:hypothetical protein
MRRFGSVLLAGFIAGLPGAAGANQVPPPPEEERVVPGQRSGFVWDGAGGCWVWGGGFRRGTEGLTAHWTGDCPDGPAEGEGRSVISWREGGRENQMVHTGRLRRGKAEGPGRLEHRPSGELVVVEEGEFRDDNLVQGRVEFLREGLVYEGAMRRGQPDGPGRLTIRGREVFDGVWENGCLRAKDGWVSFTRPAAACEGQPT